MSLMPDWAPFLSVADDQFQLIFATMVAHYWSHGCFLADGEIRSGMGRLAGIPGVLIHGRYDVSGPPDVAIALHRRWPGSRLIILDDAGHGGASFGEAIRDALDGFRTLA